MVFRKDQLKKMLWLSKEDDAMQIPTLGWNVDIQKRFKTLYFRYNGMFSRINYWRGFVMN